MLFTSLEFFIFLPLVLAVFRNFINDYEGIRGYEIVPLQIRNFKLVRPSDQDIRWTQQTLDRESRKFSARIALNPEGRLTLSSAGAI